LTTRGASQKFLGYTEAIPRKEVSVPSDANLTNTESSSAAKRSESCAERRKGDVKMPGW
jgi:hypothetical protein